MSIHETLSQVQKTLSAPKSQFNKFGGYAYRSCEDIQAAVKPLLPDGVVITVSDDLVLLADRIYVKATAAITDGSQSITAVAYAREAETKKGMDEAQITGSASSYARKYALNGLLLIDDTKDADATNDHDKKANQSERHEPANQEAGSLDAEVTARMNAAQTVPDLVKVMNSLDAEQKRLAKTTFDQRMKDIKRAA